MSLAVSSKNASESSSSQAVTGFQSLNAADRLMLVAHNSLQKVGHPGFQCQTHAWLSGRVDVEALRRALAQLNQAYPVITARLSSDDRAGPRWAYGSGEANLSEHVLDESTPEAVWRKAEALSADPHDLHREDPIFFDLLHLPDGRDVLVIRFSHVLMDGKGPESAMREIDRFFESGETSNSKDDAGTADEMKDHLYRHDRGRRMKSALRVVGSHVRLPVKSVTLSPPENREWIFDDYRIRVRRLDRETTEAAVARVKRLCGFANLSPAVLGAVFRSVHELTAHRTNRRTCYSTDVPLNLRPPGRIEPVFRNFMSFIQMSALASEIEDRDGLTQLLNTRMRDQLRRGMDLGSLQMMQFMSGHEHLLAKHLVERGRKHPITLGFGFLGPVDPSLTRFCGQAVDWFYTANIAMSPPGITLQVNQFDGCLNLILTHVTRTVPDETAEQFLERVTANLI